MTKIAILCPTRERSEQCRRMIESVRKTSSTDVRIFLFIADDDEAWSEYQKLDDPKVHRGLLSITRVPVWPTVQSWNCYIQHLMQEGLTKLFMLGADDIVFETDGWDKALIEHYEQLENKIHVYALKDSRDPSGTPHPIVTREYIETMGYFLPPIFLHWFCDTWTVEIARANNVFTHMDNFSLLHEKPSDTGQPDETHNRIRRMGWHERDKYVNDICQHFLYQEKWRLMEALAKTNPNIRKSIDSLLLKELRAAERVIRA